MADSGGTTGSPITGGTVLGGEGVGLEPTLLAPARYAQIMQIFPPHFFQMAGAKAPLKAGCDSIWDHDAREQLVWAIGQAEFMIAKQLGFWPAPKWIVGEEHRIGRVRSDWQNAEFKTDWRYVQYFGTRDLALLQADAYVTYTDDDSDPKQREETATVGTPGIYSYLTPCDDVCEPRVFFREDDGAWDDADPRFEIRNLRTDIDGSAMYLKGESSMFIKPTLWTLTEAECYGETDWQWPFDTDNLVSYVDVYCEGVDLETPVTLYWEGVCTCGTQCSHTTQAACAYVTDWDRGWFCLRPATWDGASHAWTAAKYADPPVKFTVSYLAGWPLNSRSCRMDPILEKAIVHLANALLPEPPCGYCDAAEVLWKRDRQPVDPLTPESASLPWDVYSVGALQAWRLIKMFSETAAGGIRGTS